ncbi:hypothetical protein ACWD6N_03610 [Micromonospora sp. NPDC005163]
MNGLLIATHDQAVDAIIERLPQLAMHLMVRDALAGVLEIHRAEPSETNRPNPECGSCEGIGWIEYAEVEDGPTVREHCHCRCPWCVGCEEPLCTGPCPTVEAIAEALGLLSSDPPGEAAQP